METRHDRRFDRFEIASVLPGDAPFVVYSAQHYGAVNTLATDAAYQHWNEAADRYRARLAAARETLDQDILLAQKSHVWFFPGYYRRVDADINAALRHYRVETAAARDAYQPVIYAIEAAAAVRRDQYREYQREQQTRRNALAVELHAAVWQWTIPDDEPTQVHIFHTAITPDVDLPAGTRRSTEPLNAWQLDAALRHLLTQGVQTLHWDPAGRAEFERRHGERLVLAWRSILNSDLADPPDPNRRPGAELTPRYGAPR